MNCPSCGSSETYLTGSHSGVDYVDRYHRCRDCGRGWRSWETITVTVLEDGSIRRESLQAFVGWSQEKAPVPTAGA